MPVLRAMIYDLGGVCVCARARVVIRQALLRPLLTSINKVKSECDVIYVNN